MNRWPNWPDARGWIGIGVFAISVMLLWMMKDDELRGDEFFQTIATVVISNGLMAVVAWAYASTKSGGERAEAVANIAERATDALAQSTPAVDTSPAPKDAKEAAEQVAGAAEEKAEEIINKVAPSDEELPPHAR